MLLDVENFGNVLRPTRPVALTWPPGHCYLCWYCDHACIFLQKKCYERIEKLCGNASKAHRAKWLNFLKKKTSVLQVFIDFSHDERQKPSRNFSLFRIFFSLFNPSMASVECSLIFDTKKQTEKLLFCISAP